MGISLCVQSDADSCGGCPDEKETNHSELDNTSDRTVMVVIIFTGDACARLYISRDVSADKDYSLRGSLMTTTDGGCLCSAST